MGRGRSRECQSSHIHVVFHKLWDPKDAEAAGEHPNQSAPRGILGTLEKAAPGIPGCWIGWKTSRSQPFPIQRLGMGWEWAGAAPARPLGVFWEEIFLQLVRGFPPEG